MKVTTEILRTGRLDASYHIPEITEAMLEGIVRSFALKRFPVRVRFECDDDAMSRGEVVGLTIENGKLLAEVDTEDEKLEGVIRLGGLRSAEVYLERGPEPWNDPGPMLRSVLVSERLYRVPAREGG